MKSDNGNVKESEAALEIKVSVYGSLEILVNNAGVSAFKHVNNHDVDLADVTKLMAIILRSIKRCPCNHKTSPD